MRWRTVLLTVLACGCGCGESTGSTPAPDSGFVWTPCEDPQEILLLPGMPSGYVRCADGSVNRVEAVSLVGIDYSASVPACPKGVSDHLAGCHADADCGDDALHQCAYRRGSEVNTCNCVTLCDEDSDCDVDQVCAPPQGAEGLDWPMCVHAGCRTGAECASGECGVVSKEASCS